MLTDATVDILMSADFREVDTVILLGIEAHVCVNTTCIDLIHRGYNVSMTFQSKVFWF